MSTLQGEAEEMRERIKKLAKFEKQEKGQSAMNEELKKMEQETGISVSGVTLFSPYSFGSNQPISVRETRATTKVVAHFKAILRFNRYPDVRRKRSSVSCDVRRKKYRLVDFHAMATFESNRCK